MNFLRFSFLLIVIFTISCNGPKDNDQVVITGQVRNAKDVRIVFQELNPDSSHSLDSVLLDDIGLFRFKCNPEEQGFYVLKFSSGDQIVLLVDKGEKVFLETDPGKRPFDYSVQGSPGSEILRNFYSMTTKNLNKVDSLRSVLMQYRESPDFYKLSLSFDTLFLKLVQDQKHLQKDFVRQNPYSLASLFVLNYKFGLVPVLNMKDDFAVYLAVDSVLSEKYPSNKHVLFHHQRVAQHQRQEKEKQSLLKPK